MNKEYKCGFCGKEFNPPRYYWTGLRGIFCSKDCAADGRMDNRLIKDEI